jgi:cell wall-associated NlpC family hydrolase
MVSKIILCLALLLALALAPQTSLAVPTKGVDKKTSSAKKSTKTCHVSKSSSRSSSKEKRSYSSSRRRHRSYSRDDDEDYADDSSSRSRSSEDYADDDFVPTYYKPYKSASKSVSSYDPTPTYNATPTRAGIIDSKPLMKVTPQRDGRFLLEPLGPKPKVGPNSKADEKKDVASGGKGYNRYEPWNFRDLVLSMAKGYQGTPYCMGGSLEYGNSTDCSGFVQYIYKGFKINMPRSSSEQSEVGQTVTHTLDYSKLLPGDILFFSRAGHSVGHTGIYLGDGKMIHASSYRTGVIITDLREGNYDNRFVVAKRVFEVAYLK